jgi:hypothetical protein
MSNGPEHYRTAERLLADMPTVADWRDRPDEAEEHRRLAISAAQVHATLALAAVTAERMASRGPGDIPYHWQEIVHPNDVEPKAAF